MTVQVLVTGAAGNLGRGLCAELTAQGYGVRALVRDAAQQPEDLARQLGGVHTVLHLASSSAASAQLQQQAHLDLPRRLLDGAAAAGVRRFVQFSSVKALAGEMAPTPLAVDAAAQPNSDYGRYKLAAEQQLQQHPAMAALQGVILRLPMVYGPGGAGNFSRLVTAVRSGLPLPAAADNRRSVLAQANLNAFVGHLLAADADPAPGVITAHLADAHASSTVTLLEWVAAACGRPLRYVSVPERWARRLQNWPLAGGVLARLSGSLVLDTASLGSHWPGWQAPLATPEAVAAAVQLDPSV